MTDDPEAREDLADLVLECRLRGDLTQAGLAAHLGVSEATVQHWESGRRRPSAAREQQIREYLASVRDREPVSETGPQLQSHNLSKSRREYAGPAKPVLALRLPLPIATAIRALGGADWVRAVIRQALSGPTQPLAGRSYTPRGRGRGKLVLVSLDQDCYARVQTVGGAKWVRSQILLKLENEQ